MSVERRSRLNANGYPEGFERLKREGDVGLALDGPRDFDDTWLTKNRKREKQARYVLGAYVAGKLERSRAQAPLRGERKAAKALKVASCGDELFGERGERSLSQPPGTGEGCVCAKCAGNGKHESKRGARFTAIECSPSQCAQDSVLLALGYGVDAQSLLRPLHLCAKRFKTANRCLDIGARGVAGHVSHAVGQRGGDDEAVCDGFRGNCGYGAGKMRRCDASDHREASSPIRSLSAGALSGTAGAFAAEESPS